VSDQKVRNKKFRERGIFVQGAHNRGLFEPDNHALGHGRGRGREVLLIGKTFLAAEITRFENRDDPLLALLREHRELGSALLDEKDGIGRMSLRIDRPVLSKLADRDAAVPGVEGTRVEGQLCRTGHHQSVLATKASTGTIVPGTWQCELTDPQPPASAPADCGRNPSSPRRRASKRSRHINYDFVFAASLEDLQYFYLWHQYFVND